MVATLEFVNALVWGVPALVLILGVGVFFTFRTKFVQFRLFPQAVRYFLNKLRPDLRSSGVSPMQALCTALAATVGTGNIAGVAGAMALGGPGAIFWMWICAILGMAIKFAEATLAVAYRKRENGEFVGGPMYMICTGLGSKWRPLAVVYAFFGVVAAFGVGNATQVNAVITGINEAIRSFGGEPNDWINILIGIGMAILIGLTIFGGAKRIGQTAQLLIPFASCAYLLLGLFVLVVRCQSIPYAFSAIFRGAFSPSAVTGGIIGSAITALHTGVSRGVFTNEAGLGTASIAHAGADVAHPVQQGLMGIMEVFLDTIVICTMTALVILVSGVSIPYGVDTGAALTTLAFQSVCGKWVSAFLAGALCCFAFATILGWGLYGARCAQFLFGSRGWKTFATLQVIVVVLSTVMGTSTVWLLAETVNGLMAIPNLIALAAFNKKLCCLLIDYTRGGTYENFH